MKIPRLADVMSASPIYIDAEATIKEAHTLMAQHHVRHLPVMEKGLLEGVLSERDIKYASLPGHRLSHDEQLTVADLCPTRAYIADIDDPLDKIVDIMSEQKITEVIVLNNGELAGIYTSTDCSRVLSEIFKNS